MWNRIIIDHIKITVGRIQEEQVLKYYVYSWPLEHVMAGQQSIECRTSWQGTVS